MLAARNRVRVDTEQRQDAGRGGLDALPVQIDVIQQCRVGCGERLQYRDRQAGVAARRVDRKVHIFSELRNAAAGLAPVVETFFPERRLSRGKLVGRLALVGCRPFVDPGTKIVGAELWKREQDIAHVTLGIQRDNRNVIERRLLQQADAETGFARTRHADDDSMCRQVLRVVQNEVVGEFVGFAVVALADIERTKFFEVQHRS